MHDRVIVDNMSEFEHSSSRAGCTFSMQDSRNQRNKIDHVQVDCIGGFTDRREDRDHSTRRGLAFRFFSAQFLPKLLESNPHHPA